MLQSEYKQFFVSCNKQKIKSLDIQMQLQPSRSNKRPFTRKYRIPGLWLPWVIACHKHTLDDLFRAVVSVKLTTTRKGRRDDGAAQACQKKKKPRMSYFLLTVCGWHQFYCYLPTWTCNTFGFFTKKATRGTFPCKQGVGQVASAQISRSRNVKCKRGTNHREYQSAGRGQRGCCTRQITARLSQHMVATVACCEH